MGGARGPLAAAEIGPAASVLNGLVAGRALEPLSRRGVAMIDPRSKRRDWLRSLAIDGRRSKLPYRDYADFMRAGGPGA